MNDRPVKVHSVAHEADKPMTETRACTTCGATSPSDNAYCSNGFHAPGATYWPAETRVPEELVERLWLATKHGDADHQQWLRDAFTAFFAGQPVPAPRGKGNKEALIASLSDTASTLQSDNDRLRARVAVLEGEYEHWLPMKSAPKCGALLELVVDYSKGDHPLNDATLACTIGFNNFLETGDDTWEFAGWSWQQDVFTQGVGKVVAWRPSRLNACDDELPPLPSAALDPGGDNIIKEEK